VPEVGDLVYFIEGIDFDWYKLAVPDEVDEVKMTRRGPMVHLSDLDRWYAPNQIVAHGPEEGASFHDAPSYGELLWD